MLGVRGLGTKREPERRRGTARLQIYCPGHAHTRALARGCITAPYDPRTQLLRNRLDRNIPQKALLTLMTVRVVYFARKMDKDKMDKMHAKYREEWSENKTKS